VRPVAGTWDSVQEDRATGAIVGMAVGNALGNGYAFESAMTPQIQMRPGGLGPYEAGEWADDTAMAVPILEAISNGEDLLAESTMDRVASRWAQWFTEARDVAPAVAAVLAGYNASRGAGSLRDMATELHEARPSEPPGNGSLMRTTPLTLGGLEDPDLLARGARAYSHLTHGSPEAADACLLLNLAQRHAILTGEFELAAGLGWIPADRRDTWENSITRAEIGVPRDFAIRNGLAVQMLQTVWSAIIHSDRSEPRFEDTLRTVIAAGGDTATSGAIAGGLLGARWGVSSIPLEWRRRLHGWPGLRDRDLITSVWESLFGRSWPSVFEHDPFLQAAVPHPLDPHVWLGGLAGLRPLPDGVDAVVSLCRVGRDQTPQPAVAPEEHVSVWLVDSEDPAMNPNLESVTAQTVELVARLRDEGRTVYLHCSDGRSRSPFVAAMYGARLRAIPAIEVLRQIRGVMPSASPNPLFERMLATHA